MLWSIGAWRRLKGLLYFYIVYSGLRNLYCTARFVDIHILLGMGAIVCHIMGESFIEVD